MPETELSRTALEPQVELRHRPFRFRSLRHGCYLLRYTPRHNLFFHYDGTMRVQREGFNTIASGDLYLHQHYVYRHQPYRIPSWPSPTWPPFRPLEPNPSGGIPIFARSRYRYYVRVTQILEWLTVGDSFTLGFELHRFDASSETWTQQGTFTARMTWKTAPSGYPSGADYLEGDVKSDAGIVVGTLSMGWVSSYLRRAVIEIDRVSASEAPLDNGDGIDWRDIFDDVGWDVTVVESDADLDEPSGESWSDAEMHAEMLAQRDASNLDAEWRYHLLCVRQLDSTSRGIMYDAYGGDSNNIPREGAGISSHWMIPNQDPWGAVKGQRFGAATAPYFRTAVHELGHAMGLYHNTADTGFMNTTGVIASSATPPTEFPDNVQWSFAADDAKRLRHMPDIWVRPGGIPFGQSYTSAPISPDDAVLDADGLVLNVSPLLEAVPMGAPVRIDVELVNTSDEALPVPASLSLKAGHVQGTVIDPSGTARAYRPIVRCIDDEELRLLEPGERMTHSMTLLRGDKGALFPAAGLYQVTVKAQWDLGGIEVGLTGSTSVMVTPPQDEAHAKAACKILSTPDALLTLAIGGDHLKDGVEAIQAGIDNPVLRPHFAIIEAKRLGDRFGAREPEFDKAMELLRDEEVVLSGAEIKRAAELVERGKATQKNGAAKKTAQVLKDKIKHVAADDTVVAKIRAFKV